MRDDAAVLSVLGQQVPDAQRFLAQVSLDQLDAETKAEGAAQAADLATERAAVATAQAEEAADEAEKSADASFFGSVQRVSL